MKVYIQKTATEETKARILLQNMQEIKSEEFSLWINTAFLANLLDSLQDKKKDRTLLCS
jgi:hypothetical protein